MNFSANLGFLFTELALPDRIRAAKAAGFSAVECHFPYSTPPAEISAALRETELSMLGLNTVPGDVLAGDFGLAAVPGREQDARDAIDMAVRYGAAIGAGNVHVMAGKTDAGAQADTTYRANLKYACDVAATAGLNILIEPINHRDVPGYHISRVEQAADLIGALALPNLRLMFDCYHTQIMQGDLTERLRRHMDVIGHIQIAAVPDRGEPDDGEVHYPNLIAAIREMGFTGPIGAEYKPRGRTTEEGLGWLSAYDEVNAQSPSTAAA
ncbi:hydroxypyruvate isomerase family protein [Roseibium salinum]|uniref:TIM barrel protein n=1 Tax=Roseibium salinum TaxID=1604349 RepID=A0ABT3QW97_9HYPH|nr:TIM barrel protein [Roseibium sp. DSM 29163]MCX2721145.1 TIM barrel protein [Roseibium sp. DSM 29163]